MLICKHISQCMELRINTAPLKYKLSTAAKAAH